MKVQLPTTLLIAISALAVACEEPLSHGVCGFPKPYVEVAVDLSVDEAVKLRDALVATETVRAGRESFESDILSSKHITPPRVRIRLSPETDRNAVRATIARVVKEFGGEETVKGMSFVLLE